MNRWTRFLIAALACAAGAASAQTTLNSPVPTTTTSESTTIVPALITPSQPSLVREAPRGVKPAIITVSTTPPVIAVDGVAVTALPAMLLVAEVVDRVGALGAGVAVVASLAPGGLAQSRHLVKRLRAVLPDLPIVAVRWGPPDGADEARQQLLAAGATEFAPSLLEARERILQYRQVRAEVTPSHAA